MRAATITARTRRTPPAANSLDAYTRSKTEAEALVLQYYKEKGLPVAIVRPGFIYGERDRTVLPKLLNSLRKGVFAYFGPGTQALNCIYVKNLVHGIFLAAEKPEALGEVFNLTDGARVSKEEFVGRVAELAGLPKPTRHIPLGVAKVLAGTVEKIAKLRGAKNPPLINKARYKFLGLNLDFSIEKARRVLGYEPPFTTEQGLVAALADLVPQSTREAGGSVSGRKSCSGLRPHGRCRGLLARIGFHENQADSVSPFRDRSRTMP